MRFIALASDYDGTLASQGVVSAETVEALDKLKRSGRRLILVTGRVLPELLEIFPQIDLFDSVVAENGALLYTPASREKRPLASPPNALVVDGLKARGVHPLGCGEVIIATWSPHEKTVLDVIHELGLELQVIFNKGAVMVLPPGINKRSGLCEALDSLGLSAHNVVGVGDAENDHAFLNACEFSVAVANALPAVKETADMCTVRDHGAGVVELIDMMLQDDLASRRQELRRRSIPVGREAEHEISIQPYGMSVLVCGASGSGKSTLVAGVLEALIHRQYQVCLIDPEGDYDDFPAALVVGDEKQAPSIELILQALRKPASQVIVNLTGKPLEDRPPFFASLLPRLQEMRVRIGRPHWLVIDAAHHMLPLGWQPASAQLAGELNNLILITVHPDHVAPAAIETVNAVFAVGPSAAQVISDFARVLRIDSPRIDSPDLAPGQALAWFRDSGSVHRVDVTGPAAERKRHKRKYAHGTLGQDKSFYFRGPRGQLNLRAQNLMLFLQLAEGVDHETWLYHLRRRDYSTWIRNEIKDEELAAEVAQVESDPALGPVESRERIKGAIERRYTAPV